MRLVMSGTVRGLPLLTPVKEPASDDENTRFHEGLKAWKKADLALRNQLPPCEQFDIIHAEKYGRGFTVNPLFQDHKTGPFWSEPSCECERCLFEADRGRDKNFVRYAYYNGMLFGCNTPLLRLGLACDAVLAQLPLNKHGRNPSNYGETKVH